MARRLKERLRGIVVGHWDRLLTGGITLGPFAFSGFGFPSLACLTLLSLGNLFGLSAGLCLLVFELFCFLPVLELLAEVGHRGGLSCLFGSFGLGVSSRVGAASLAEDGIK